MSRSEDVAAATARRNEIVNHLLEFLTGDTFTTKELQHYRFVADIFSISPVIKELCADSSTIEARTELALAAAMCALNIAIDDSPPLPSQRILERREARAESRSAAKEFEQRVASLKAAGKPEPEPVQPVKSPSIYNQRRSKLSPEELERVRVAARERQARWRAKARAR